MANILIYLYNGPCFQNLLLLFKQLLFSCALVLVIIGSISYGFIRRKQINVPDTSSEQCENESVDLTEQQEEQNVTIIPSTSEVSTINQTDNSCEVSPQVSVTLSDDFPLDENISAGLSRQLLCYCDGSYSYKTQIGFSGFRTSNGLSKYRRCPLRHPRSGSTECEVFAGCLALQYTAEYDYDTIILYTDSSKVEQLVKRPKNKDYNDYSEFFKAVKQCQQNKDDFHIEIERVRGHTTRYEQRQCSLKREFAKVDQQVRQKRRSYERRNQLKNNLILIDVVQNTSELCMKINSVQHLSSHPIAA